MTPSRFIPKAQSGVLAVMLALAAMSPAASAQDDPRSPMHDVVSEEALRKQVNSGPSFDAMMKEKTKAVGKDRPSPQSSLLTSSLFLSDGNVCTVIPVGSILHLPEKHRAKVISKPEGDFTFWPNFLKLNESWLAAKEVPLAMAKGDRKAAEAVFKSLSGSSKVMVSVYKGGPISILEPAPENTAAAPASTEAEAAAGEETKEPGTSR